MEAFPATSPRRVCSYEFGSFRLVVGEKQLLNNGAPVLLMPKAFDILLSLLSRHGHLVEKADLMREVWPDSVVEESNLAQNIHHLRKALGDEARDYKFIETVPRRGYRFIAGVVEIFEEESPAVQRQPAAAVSNQGEASRSVLNEAARAPRRTAARFMATRALPVALLAAFACAGWLVFKGGQEPSRSQGERKQPQSIAVLPFETLGGGGGADVELLGLGMADAVIGKLSGSQSVPVLPTGSVLRYAGRTTDPLTAGRELGVEAVIGGTVQVSGQELRVGIQLVSVADKRAVWSGTFGGRFDNVFALQDMISEKVAAELALQLTPDGSKESAGSQTRDAEAYQAYLMGLYRWSKRSESGLAEAIEYLRRATEKDPSFAQAHALLADSYMLVIYNGYDLLSPAEAHRRAKAAAARALEADAKLAEAHTALAAVLSYEGDGDAARNSLTRAIALKPTYAVARLRYGWHLARVGRLEEAVEEMKMAQKFDPLSAVNNTSLTCVLNYARRYDEAVRYGQLAVELDPNLYDAHINLGEAYEFSGSHREAVAEFEKARALDPQNTYAVECLGHLYARTRQDSAARRELLSLERAAEQSTAPLYGIALIYAALGRKEQAVGRIEQAILSGSVRASHFRYDPKLDSLRGQPGFKEMLARHGLIQ